MPAKKKINVKEAIELKKIGLTYEQIAKNYGVSKQAVFIAFKNIKKCPKCGESLY